MRYEDYMDDLLERLFPGIYCTANNPEKDEEKEEPTK